MQKCRAYKLASTCYTHMYCDESLGLYGQPCAHSVGDEVHCSNSLIDIQGLSAGVSGTVSKAETNFWESSYTFLCFACGTLCTSFHRRQQKRCCLTCLVVWIWVALCSEAPIKSIPPLSRLLSPLPRTRYLLLLCSWKLRQSAWTLERIRVL